MLRGDLVNARRKFLKAYEREPGNPTIANNLQLLTLELQVHSAGSCTINLMAPSASLSHVLLVITAAVLFDVALTYFKEFKIRNEFILVLAALFVVHALLSGRWVSAHSEDAPSPPSCSASCCTSMRRT